MSVIQILIIESDADVAALYVRSFAEPDLYMVRCDNTKTSCCNNIIVCYVMVVTEHSHNDKLHQA